MHHIPWSQLNFFFYFTSHNFLLPHSEKLPLFLASLKVLVSKGTFYTFVAFLKNLHQQLLSFGSSQASTNRLSLQVKKINPIMMLPLHLRSRFWGNSMFHGQPTSRLAIWLCFSFSWERAALRNHLIPTLHLTVPRPPLLSLSHKPNKEISKGNIVAYECGSRVANSMVFLWESLKCHQVLLLSLYLPHRLSAPSHTCMQRH